MQPFDENGGWLADGTRWDWWVIGGRWDGYMGKGNILQVKAIHPNKFKSKRQKDAEESWDNFSNDKKDKGEIVAVLWNCDPNITKEKFISDRTQGWFPSHYAFLYDRKWHERERMGFFGMSAKTECEIAGKENVHRCKAKSQTDPDAYIVTWGEDRPTWECKFYDRFIKPLSPETFLVTVDYHV
jgi:hypothetical protein